MKYTSSTHLTVTCHLGTNIRFDARMSINAGGKFEKVELSSLASPDSGEYSNGDGDFDVAIAVVKAADDLMSRVYRYLDSQGRQATREQIAEFYKSDADAEDWAARAADVLGFVCEIQYHFFSEVESK